MTASPFKPWRTLVLVCGFAALAIPVHGAGQVASASAASTSLAGRTGGSSGGSAAVATSAAADVGPATFLERQLEYPRVRQAYQRRAVRVESALDARGIEDVAEVYFRVFKHERELEVWAREKDDARFTLVTTYPVCDVSGALGPKRRRGDGQIPEGFYSIDLFNPWSNYHLSMRVDYPNPVDRVRGSRESLGGDIYIHGGCATIGCVPVTDQWIEEIYLIAAGAREAGQRRIPVHIFPTRLDDAGLRWLARHYGTDHIDYPFWQNLQQGFLAFERKAVLPRIDYDGGRYVVESGPIGTPVSQVH